MIIDFNTQTTAEIMAALKAKGLKIRFKPGKNTAPQKLKSAKINTRLYWLNL